jgi:hypothetical protein
LRKNQLDIAALNTLFGKTIKILNALCDIIKPRFYSPKILFFLDGLRVELAALDGSFAVKPAQ